MKGLAVASSRGGGLMAAWRSGGRGGPGEGLCAARGRGAGARRGLHTRARAGVAVAPGPGGVAEGAEGAGPRAGSMRALCEKVALALGACGVLPAAAPAPARDVIVSCSGGVDSCALLRAVAAVRSSAARAGAAGMNVHVLHFNHMLRPEALAEERFVAALAEEVGADSLHVRAADASAFGGPAGGFTQARARAWRRRESLALSRRYGDCFVLLGHHRDDNLETVLLKLIRGCHVSKLTGMEAAQGAFVRPMLGIGKDETVRAMRDGGHAWCEDASGGIGYSDATERTFADVTRSSK